MNTTNSERNIKVVGSGCLRDFMGHQDAEQVASYFEIIADLSSFSEDRGEGGGHIYYDLKDFLGYVAASIRAWGWLSRTAARDSGRTATADMAFVVMQNPKGQEVKPQELPIEADFARGWAALEYLGVFIDQESEKGELNDYLHNINVASRMGTIDWKAAGLVASIIPTAEREMGKEIERRKFSNLKETSKYFGQAGEKVTVKATVTGLRELDSDWGVTALVKFVTAEGNAATWFASGSLEDDVWDTQETIIIRGTVKKHEDYQGMKQTLLTRVSIVTQAQLDEEAAKAAKKALRAAKKAQKALDAQG